MISAFLSWRRKYLRNVQIHSVIAFPAGAGFQEARSPAFNLNLASSLLLDMFHVHTALPNDLRTKVESRNWLQADGYFLFRPFALWTISNVMMY
jgi:hypothetical protein